MSGAGDPRGLRGDLSVLQSWLLRLLWPARGREYGSSLSREWQALGATDRDLVRAYRTFNASAAPFLKESTAHDE